MRTRSGEMIVSGAKRTDRRHARQHFLGVLAIQFWTKPVTHSCHLPKHNYTSSVSLLKAIAKNGFTPRQGMYSDPLATPEISRYCDILDNAFTISYNTFSIAMPACPMSVRSVVNTVYEHTNATCIWSYIIIHCNDTPGAPKVSSVEEFSRACGFLTK